MDVKKIRHFNRFYTGVLDVFSNKVFKLDYSLLEMRALGEIGRESGITANKLSNILSIDKTYLSRILKKLERDGYISRERDNNDGRIYHFMLTSSGEILNDYVEKKSDEKVQSSLNKLSPHDIEKLEQSMKNIEKILLKTGSKDDLI
ncbi:MarR family winged helix-turn-helix transcriptional regulator [Lactococcus lactis]|uniref:MarR family transcriptional regulator n=1 Tax=Lactococcus lactis TaxID=1358 RepID=A0AB35KEG8_9LACT|nr:MarR family transcriptional regulator [Lactococcus lactis]MDG4979311.1 MarR family transcriptional regulator [Lactococcus lactis]MDG5049753.1 MarR family transcriptional regulator [Lactococcus lactis]